MASANDVAGAFTKQDKTGILPGIARIAGWKSDAEREAEDAQKAAIQNAKDDLELKKATATKNDSSVDDVLSQIWGTPAHTETVQRQMTGTAAPQPSAASPGNIGDNPATGGYDQFGNPQGGTQHRDAVFDGSGGLVTPEYNPPASGTAAGAPGSVAGKTYSRIGLTPGLAGPQGASSAYRGANQPGAFDYTRDVAATPGLIGGWDQALSKDSDVEKQLTDALNGIKDPNLAGYVGDAGNNVKVSDEANAATSNALGQLKDLTNVQETAQEKLMREMARRNMENQMKGDRDAMNANLKSRGVYGSGAEIAGQLGSQQEAASRRALEEMGANANAQTRAMQALGKYGDLGLAKGNQDVKVGEDANQVDQFNKTTKSAYDVNDAKQKTINNQQATARATTKADEGNHVAQDIKDVTGSKINTALAGTGLKIGTATGGANMISSGYKGLTQPILSKAAFDTQNDPADTTFGII